MNVDVPNITSLVFIYQTYFFTYSGNNSGLKGLIEAVVLIVEEPYLIASLIGIFLNIVLPHEKASQMGDTSADSSSMSDSNEEGIKEDVNQETWNQPGPVLARR